MNYCLKSQNADEINLALLRDCATSLKKCRQIKTSNNMLKYIYISWGAPSLLERQHILRCVRTLFYPLYKGLQSSAKYAKLATDGEWNFKEWNAKLIYYQSSEN